MKFLLCLVLSLWVGITMAGCQRPAGNSAAAGIPAAVASGGKPAAAPSVQPSAPLSEADLTKARVNEAGKIPILEYHRIRIGKSNYDRSPADLRKDLETLYQEGYRPISLHDYIDNRIDVPLGMTPVVFTFDDGDRTQFHYREDGSLDPDCAVGILKAFHESHPDFALKATFFVNAAVDASAPPVFGQPETAEKKMKELLAMGMEVGNHTVTHPSLKKLSDAQVQKELAGCVAGIHKLAPEAVVDTMALPFGISPRDKKLAEAGEADGVQYHNRAVLLVGANPAPSPCDRKFNPLRIPRIQAYGGPLGSDYWLRQFREHPKMRYVSDGDPTAVTVPTAVQEKIDSERLGSAKLRTY